MDLMEIRNGRAFPSVHALMLEPFKTVWEADSTAQKEHAIKVFSYTEFMCSPKKSNVFISYNEVLRPKKILKEIYGNEDKLITEWMIMCVMKYKELLAIASPTYELLETGLATKDKLIKYLKGIDFEERTNNNVAVIKPKEVNEALRQIPQITKDLLANREKVVFELEEDAKTRSQREVGYFER